MGERKRGMGKRNGERGFACRFGHDSGSHGYLYNNIVPVKTLKFDVHTIYKP